MYVGSQNRVILGVPFRQPPYGITVDRGEPVELEAEIADEYLAMKTAGKPDWKEHKEKKVKGD